MVCDFNCFVETEGHLKVTDSHVHCKCGSVFKTVQDREIVNIEHQ